MSAPVNTMSDIWCAARRHEVREYLAGRRNLSPDQVRTLVVELLSQADAPPDLLPLQQAARAAVGCKAASDTRNRRYRERATPAVVLALTERLGSALADVAQLQSQLTDAHRTISDLTE